MTAFIPSCQSRPASPVRRARCLLLVAACRFLPLEQSLRFVFLTLYPIVQSVSPRPLRVISRTFQTFLSIPILRPCASCWTNCLRFDKIILRRCVDWRERPVLSESDYRLTKEQTGSSCNSPYSLFRTLWPICQSHRLTHRC